MLATGTPEGGPREGRQGEPTAPRPPARDKDALTHSAILMAAGVLVAAVAVCFGLLPMTLNVEPIGVGYTIALGVLAASALVLTVVRLPGQITAYEDLANQEQEPERSTRLYGIYLVGTGYILLLQALTCSIVFAALSWSVGRGREGRLLTAAGEEAPPAGGVLDPGTEGVLANFGELFGSSAEDAYYIAGLFLLSSMVAILGALFFFCTALWKRMGEPERDPFDRRVFWAGLWFRVGEALLFNVVFFLVLRSYAPDQFLLLPLVSLLIGMFLKAGESLVSGIANRVFASIQALVPTEITRRRLLRLLSFRLDGFPGEADEGENGQQMDEVILAIREIPGVEEVTLQPAARTVRVEYDAAATSPRDIRRKVAVRGLRMADVR